MGDQYLFLSPDHDAIAALDPRFRSYALDEYSVAPHLANLPT